MGKKAKNKNYPRIIWDCGTAYDFFISLGVLHHPAHYGMRPAWSAGVRARLGPDDRQTLEQVKYLLQPDLRFLYDLPEPKDGNAALWTLSRLTPEERINMSEAGCTYFDEEARNILANVSDRKSWNDQDRDGLTNFFKKWLTNKLSYTPRDIVNVLEWFSHPKESGERYLKALRSYYEVFFAEEEKRIQPVLKESLSQAKKLAERYQFPYLLEELSEGLHPAQSEWSLYSEVVLTPSFWGTPLVFSGKISDTCGIYIYGARPAHIPLIPGEIAPDVTIKALKALSDPTRLSILQFISREHLTPAQIAKRLRLRLPTINHHLNTLRLARLVRIVRDNNTRTKVYAARLGAIENLFSSLSDFLNEE